MSAFVTPLAVELMVDEDGYEMRSRGGKQLWRIIEHPFVYRSDVAATTIVAEVGFVTDFASIPRIVGWMFGDIAHRASLPHDYEYSNKGTLTREMADEVLFEACLLSGIPKWKARLIYAGVRAGGMFSFRVKDSSTEESVLVAP